MPQRDVSFGPFGGIISCLFYWAPVPAFALPWLWSPAVGLIGSPGFMAQHSILISGLVVAIKHHHIRRSAGNIYLTDLESDCPAMCTWFNGYYALRPRAVLVDLKLQKLGQGKYILSKILSLTSPNFNLFKVNMCVIGMEAVISSNI